MNADDDKNEKISVNQRSSESQQEETVIAWLWARTVKCPNPACNAQMPLVRSFDLSKKKGHRTWVEPQVDPRTHKITFEIKTGKGQGREGTVNRQGATCLACGTPVPFDHVRTEGRAGRMSAQLMAIVTEGKNGRNYYAPTPVHEAAAQVTIPDNAPDTDLPEQALGFRVQLYGMTKHRDLFTPRQLTALTTFSDLVAEARQQIEADARATEMSRDDTHLSDGGTGAKAYAEALSVYLSASLSRVAMGCNTLARWNGVAEKVQHCFGRQALPMVWDFADPNPFTESTGSWASGFKYVADPLALPLTSSLIIT